MQVPTTLRPEMRNQVSRLHGVHARLTEVVLPNTDSLTQQRIGEVASLVQAAADLLANEADRDRRRREYREYRRSLKDC